MSHLATSILVGTVDLRAATAHALPDTRESTLPWRGESMGTWKTEMSCD